METWASYAEQGRNALLRGEHEEFGRLVDANFDLRSENYRISDGNLEMIRLARAAGATANFAGSGGAITGTYRDEAMFQNLQESLAKAGVGVIKPDITGASRVPPEAVR
jgi:glucuronokinase